jgi:8-oxo-dGTP pyrophosphatase MutT (NUDIX family)
MTRVEYYHDVAAPQARGLLPVAFAIVRHSVGRVLPVRRADDGYWELPRGRVEVGESASAAVIREVAERLALAITVTGLAGVYSDPGHVLAYPHEDGVYQQFAVCFRAFTPVRDAQPEHDKTSGAAWFDPEQATQLVMHPAMRQRLTAATPLPTVTDIGCSRVNPDTSIRPPSPDTQPGTRST